MRKFLTATFCGMLASTACAQNVRFISPSDAHLVEESAILQELVRHSLEQHGSDICLLTTIPPPPGDIGEIVLRAIGAESEISHWLTDHTNGRGRVVNAVRSVQAYDFPGFNHVTESGTGCSGSVPIAVTRPVIFDDAAYSTSSVYDACRGVGGVRILSKVDGAWTIVGSTDSPLPIGGPPSACAQHGAQEFQYTGIFIRLGAE